MVHGSKITAFLRAKQVKNRKSASFWCRFLVKLHFLDADSYQICIFPMQNRLFLLCFGGQIKVFTIPSSGNEQMENEINKFLRSHRVLQ